MIIYLVRHPETVWNVKGIRQGHKDSPLTLNGIKTAEKLGKRLSKENIEIIYSSDLGRCIQTAEIINKYLKKKIIKAKELRERNHGIFNGKLKKLIDEKLDLSNPNEVAPDGESFNQMKDRVLSFIKSLRGYNKVLLVAHEGTVRAILSDYYKLAPSSEKCDNSSENICRIKNGKLTLLN